MPIKLSDLFVGIASKNLAAVDLPGLGSNQHELNGVAGLRDLFGTELRTKDRISWHFFSDDEDCGHSDGEFTFYDARAKSADRTGRSEWRFYYTGDFLSRASIGDLVVIAKSVEGRVFGMVFRRSSAWARAASFLFGLTDPTSEFETVRAEKLAREEIELVRREILDELGIELRVPVDSNDEAIVAKKFGRTFPTTSEMSIFARSQVEVDWHNCDLALLEWLDREESLFRALERSIIGERIAAGFGDVDDFIEFSLSVQNRRKSRMGSALQHHLAELFTRNGLRFTPQARTEGRSRPDFIFPGETEYHDRNFDTGHLLMLGAKSTAKDRWRQVLVEADRIKDKHLCTLEAGISEHQTDEMRKHRLTLVIPERVQITYTARQRAEVLSVGAFIESVRRGQNA